MAQENQAAHTKHAFGFIHDQAVNLEAFEQFVEELGMLFFSLGHYDDVIKVSKDVG